MLGSHFNCWWVASNLTWKRWILGCFGVNQHDHYRFKRTLQSRNIQSAVKVIMSYLIHYISPISSNLHHPPLLKLTIRIHQVLEASPPRNGAPLGSHDELLGFCANPGWISPARRRFDGGFWRTRMEQIGISNGFPGMLVPGGFECTRIKLPSFKRLSSSSI